MSNYPFKAGDTGTCRDGVTKFEVLRVMKDGQLAVYLTDGANEYVNVRLGDGRFCSTGMSCFDLMPPTQKIEFWVNVYVGGGLDAFSSLEVANQHAGNLRIACLYYPPREFEPGEGL